MEEKKMLDLVVQENNFIELPEKVMQHLGVEAGEELRVLFTEDAVILMTPYKFGELYLKKS